MRIGINGRHLGPNKTGVGRYLLNLLQVWQQNPRGHHFVVYVSTEQLELEDEALFVDGSPLQLRRLVRPLGSFHLWYNITLPRAMQRDDIDWFFSPDYFSPWRLPKGMRRSQTIHDVSFLSHPEWFPRLYRWYGTWFSKRPAATSDVLFTISEFSRQEILKHMSIDASKIIISPLAADQRFAPPATMSQKHQSSHFLFVGKIFNRRHVWELLKAFQLFLEKTPGTRVQLIIRGANETKPYQDISGLAASINQERGRTAVNILNYISDGELIELYQRSLGFFYLSTYEGFGLPVLEAMACGTPTITVQATSIPEVAGNAAIFVDPKNVQVISDVMRRLVTDTSWGADMRRRGLEQARKFNWATTATTTLQAIERVYGV